MAIFMTQLSICEFCNAFVVESSEGDPWSDPIIKPPAGWDYVYPENADSKLSCPLCLEEAKLMSAAVDQEMERTSHE